MYYKKNTTEVSFHFSASNSLIVLRLIENANSKNLERNKQKCFYPGKALIVLLAFSSLWSNVDTVSKEKRKNNR